ncbi:guanylate cyclase [Phaeobacter gallaeciensis]|uniref:Guanylate cyclase n=2 Tax=Roseobacteraceae TaxID=2854170 RepID=A0A366X6U4_9RHOB|nr:MULTISPECIES: heme NO-binding domain-containing protein [Roseobacteraceae]MBT3143173.1 heme NO-binding domain-containing protein [Falsiruegeria litorea]MBT8167654.1 heme NO-binding domain-containing protein [Falsiruegeria litorea]RBW60931.1 guanylate cyclase [Phaeobacter gallaeciensis]
MKGVVFVELLRMAETVLGEEAVDQVLDQTELQSNGAFSAVGNYPCRELLSLVDAFGERLGAPPEALQVKFGHWMFSRFVEGYPEFFDGKKDAFEMLEAIEGEVHVEVRKLYPEVELPSFATNRPLPSQLRMVYESDRPLMHFCLGLIEACIAHFEDQADIQMVEQSDPRKFRAEFLIEKAA